MPVLGLNPDHSEMRTKMRTGVSCDCAFTHGQRGRVSLMHVCVLRMFSQVFLLGDGCTCGSVVRGVDVGTDHVEGECVF